MALTIEFSITVCLTPCDFHVKKQKYRATRATEAHNLFIFSRLLGAGCLKMVLLWCYLWCTRSDKVSILRMPVKLFAYARKAFCAKA